MAAVCAFQRIKNFARGRGAGDAAGVAKVGCHVQHHVNKSIKPRCIASLDTTRMAVEASEVIPLPFLTKSIRSRERLPEFFDRNITLPKTVAACPTLNIGSTLGTDKASQGCRRVSCAV